MSQQEKMKLAQEYIDKQLETMRSFGCEPKALSDREYNRMITEAARAIRR